MYFSKGAGGGGRGGGREGGRVEGGRERKGMMGNTGGENVPGKGRDSHDINTRGHGYGTVVSCLHLKPVLGCGLVVKSLLERDNTSGLVDRECRCDGSIRATDKGIQHL